MEVRSNNVPVAQITHAIGDVALCSMPPVGAGKLLGGTNSLLWNFPPGTSFLINGQTFYGDTLLMAGQAPVGPADFYTRINLQASGLPLITVTNMLASPAPLVSPVIQINQFASGKAALEWSDPRFTLQSATNTSGPWTANAFPFPQVVAMTNQQQFFRLRAP